MIDWFIHFSDTLGAACRDILPIAAIIFGSQALIIRRPIPNLRRVLAGFFYVVLGIALFLEGLETSLFPLGELMAKQLTSPTFIYASTPITKIDWQAYRWVYAFAAAIGFATTLAEPSLLAVALKAEEISGGAIGAWGLRLAVSLGVAFGIALGTYRIVTGTELYLYILAGYVVVVVQTAFAPKVIVGLAYDSGGVTTSTVTVPLVTALGLGLASTVPERDPVLDGFGLIAFASLFPIISVMGYAQAAAWLSRRRSSS